AALHPRFSGDRSHSTAIYFLLPGGTFSAFHRIQSDEGWHYYYGAPVRVHMLQKGIGYTYHDLGMDFSQQQRPQFTVPYGAWFASEPLSQEDFSLVGCTVAPGFDFADFELATAEPLSSLFPDHTDLIKRLTRA
ncbi:MAG: cupin domain-containing protein, partial [Bacteroidota bacterium]